MINRVVLVGRLTKDPELRKTQSGTSVVSYTIAVNRRSQTPGQPDADFISCVAWNKTAELMAQYLHKGSLIGVEGRIQTRNYENQQGQRVYVTEVVTDNVQFLEPKNAQPQQNAYNSYGNSNSYNSYSQPQPAPVNPYAQPVDDGFSSAFDANDTLDIASDDLPF
ncbi:single-stranded DNA-binding protein [Dubosiella muris]|uniref:Single-stranded DNA-binding protein n=2 Tax=Dubosiella TaxID=1937008 RepID=A0AC61R5L0_9FIRM|nr:single-stranded DNA-binding protein [Dubosiella muris]TGY65137.1 single-stranded DNA-binding protein [Dubosiella muris]